MLHKGKSKVIIIVDFVVLLAVCYGLFLSPVIFTVSGSPILSIISIRGRVGGREATFKAVINMYGLRWALTSLCVKCWCLAR